MPHHELRTKPYCKVVDFDGAGRSPVDHLVPGSEIRLNDTVIGTVPWVKDHRALLLKYMQHVYNEESITFIDHISDPCGCGFTREELNELRQIESELGPR